MVNLIRFPVSAFVICMMIASVHAEDRKKAALGSAARPVKGPVVSKFGETRLTKGGQRIPHAGIDFAARKDEEVLAAAAGKVAYLREDSNSFCVVIFHEGLLGISRISYCGVVPSVSAGETVRAGGKIGVVSANSIPGPLGGGLVHLEARNEKGSAIDPCRSGVIDCGH